MDKTRHIIFLVTSIVAYIGSTSGGYNSEQSKVEAIQNKFKEPLDSNTAYGVSSNKNLQSNLLRLQNLNEKQDEDNISTRYELDQTVPQNINKEQYASIVSQLEGKVYKPDNYYLNQEQVLTNTIQGKNTASPITQETNPESVNLLRNQFNSVQSDNSNKILVANDLTQVANLQSFYPSLYPNYARVGTIPVPNTVQQLPPSASQPLINGYQNQIANLLSLPQSTSEGLVSGQIPLRSNVQNVLSQANVVIPAAQTINVPSLSLPYPLSSVQSVAKDINIPASQNVLNISPLPNIGVIPAGSNPTFQLPIGTSQVLVSNSISLNPSVPNLLPQENVETPSAQPISSFPLQISSQAKPSDINHQTPINLIEQNLHPVGNVPAGEQFILNGDYTNLESQNLLSLNAQQIPITPTVTKDIYFHVAPSDFDDAPAPAPAPTLPPKKTYKIIFIKLPSQESKNTASIQSLYNQYAGREDKTLIYVLVKNPEEQQIIIPQPKPPSEHEVIFVRYKNSRENSGTVVTNEAKPKHDDSLLLKSGLINGH